MSTAPSINYSVADIEKKCVVCKATFTEIENTGRWQCRQHFGTIENNRFTCCNMITIYPNKELFYDKTSDLNRKGCVRCDHRTTLATFDDISDGVVEVPLVHAPRLKSAKGAYRLDRLPGNGGVRVYVYRYDKRAQDSKTSTMQMHRLSVQGGVSDAYNIGNSILTINK
jgi:hypothetical protein